MVLCVGCAIQSMISKPLIARLIDYLKIDETNHKQKNFGCFVSSCLSFVPCCAMEEEQSNKEKEY
jgi:hypothetical protein